MRVTISFTMETWDRLKKFVINEYGVRRALSITVEDAVKGYLDGQKQAMKLYLDTQEAFK